MEHDGRHESGGHLEVHPESAQNEHQHHDQDDVRTTADIAKAFANLSLPTVTWRDVQLARPHPGQRQQHRYEAERVEEEGRTGANRGNDQTSDPRPDETSPVKGRAVQTHSIAERLVRHHLRDEGLAGWVVHRRSHALDDGQQEDLPKLNCTGHYQNPGEQRRQGHRTLSDEQDAPLGEAVRDHSCDRRQDRQWGELQAGDDPERHR